MSDLKHIIGWGGPFFEQGAAELVLRLTGKFEAVLLGSPDLLMSPRIESVATPPVFWHGYVLNKEESAKLRECKHPPFDQLLSVEDGVWKSGKWNHLGRDLKFKRPKGPLGQTTRVPSTSSSNVEKCGWKCKDAAGLDQYLIAPPDTAIGPDPQPLTIHCAGLGQTCLSNEPADIIISNLQFHPQTYGPTEAQRDEYDVDSKSWTVKHESTSVCESYT